MLVKASVYFGSDVKYASVGYGGGGAAQRGAIVKRCWCSGGRWRNARPLCPAPRTPAECPRSRPRLRRAASALE